MLCTMNQHKWLNLILTSELNQYADRPQMSVQSLWIFRARCLHLHPSVCTWYDHLSIQVATSGYKLFAMLAMQFLFSQFSFSRADDNRSILELAYLLEIVAS